MELSKNRAAVRAAEKERHERVMAEVKQKRADADALALQVCEPVHGHDALWYCCNSFRACMRLCDARTFTVASLRSRVLQPVRQLCI